MVRKFFRSSSAIDW